MLELGVGADLLRGLGWVLWAFLALGLYIAYRKPSTPMGKALAILGVLTIFFAPMIPNALRAHEHKQRYEKAKVLFDERCKTAGEKIYRTVEGVEGVLLLNPRTEPVNFSDQYKLDDPYGYSGSGESYIKLFIRGRSTVPTTIGSVVDAKDIVTYKFVETPLNDGKGYARYTTNVSKEDSERFTRNGGGDVPIVKAIEAQRSAKFGIAWADISTKLDRDYWIAGSSLKIIDLANGEVIAERIGYMFDTGQGSTAGGRSPWAFARENSCPSLFDQKNFYFFDRVLKPKH